MPQLVVKSLNGEIFTASAQVERVRRINGERELSLSFLCNEINNEFLSDIEACWKVNFQGDWYHLFNMKEDRHGNKSFNAVLDFYFNFNQIWYMDEVENKSMTISESIGSLFIGTDYILQIVDNFYANTMTYSKQENSTQRFMYFIERHKAEFVIPIGTKIVQLRNRIGVRRSDIVIHEDDNLINLDIDTDTSSFCTAIECFYDFIKVEGSDEPQPKGDFFWRSPMVEKYGMILGEPIYDERYKNIASVSEAARLKQESTYKMSFSVDASLFDTALNEGDEVRLIIPSKAINTYIRVVDINEKFDEEGDLIEASYTFGNENIAAQYRQLQYDAIQDIRDIMQGKKPIPFSVLPRAVKEATDIINAGATTQFYYRKDGIYGYNTSNPQGVTRYNANGIGFSQDGGQTFENAMTYLGIVATAITSGTINTNNVTIYGSEGYNRIEITGDKLKVWDSRDPDVYTEMTRGGFKSNKGAFDLIGYDGRQEYFNGVRQYDLDLQIQQFNNPAYVEFTGRDMRTTEVEFQRVYCVWTTFRSQYITLSGSVRLEGSSTSNSGQAEIRIWHMTEGKAMATERYTINKSFDPDENNTLYWSIKVDLKDYFSKNPGSTPYKGYPDKRSVNLYVEIRMVNRVNTDDKMAMRVNRGWMDG
ncbi:phage tail protein [Macrococcus bovicus]|uniref:Tail spike domain-containing protein n=1 Tax=Macrococcus bovicus TaxID=69968 RepID=A0A4R6C3E3_9STAP|nr:phage tail protein [Macrococcus bovicus]TDM15693.1 hypothetical protein ERX55_01945 [Macrococcus bovicus]